ncbi:MAG: diaminopimelate decarboxylase [Bacteroidaceae bacterium]|nr:diaminopimelate decarboxylase [Bacteroidaceae bacterium]MBQ5912199.1 diaminopimelate decarboxylase [Bacteroidaceae bacterium]
MFPLEKFQQIDTPFYYYDTELLRQTLSAIRDNITPEMHVHYAVKACANPKVLSIIAQEGFGADCVSGGEVQAAIDAGFPAEKIVYAGVGKSDREIILGLEHGIFAFNVESIPELEIINQLALQRGKVARVALRINPNVGAHTHANITTGLAENKFGIDMQDMEDVIRRTQEMQGIQFIGLHFHIGSQILEMDDFIALCHRINEIQERLEAAGFPTVSDINVGGGLGVDYQQPNEHPIPDFKAYFQAYKQNLKLRHGQQLHFELGRAIVCQCGTLLTRVLYIKSNPIKNFCIVDAGMTDLIRPALYGSYHHIENLSAQSPSDYVTYDVVGPICESSDVFIKNYGMPRTQRGDIIAIRSAGAYGEIMASGYNCRQLPKGYTTEDLA